MKQSLILKLEKRDGPVIAAAIHNGHLLRKELAGMMLLPDSERLREEDPFTGELACISGSRIIVETSRFEVDLNRPRGKAVYMEPEDAWGLEIWKTRPGDDVISASLKEYNSFYRKMRLFLDEFKKKHNRFVILDLHTYNHRRDGKEADPDMNPEVNIGTGSMERDFWGPVADRFIDDLRSYDFFGRSLDVRENIKFKGGWFSRWVHKNYPRSACVLAVEFKKFFMDEWTGEADRVQLEEIKRALSATLPGLMEELSKLRETELSRA
ncbi:MAG: N-formylglutamate amidohydrolase [Chloroflexi bacterium]|nr:N-formylglutamate amidohydrolase [Chloroflexota bacterium]